VRLCGVKVVDFPDEVTVVDLEEVEPVMVTEQMVLRSK